MKSRFWRRLLAGAFVVVLLGVLAAVAFLRFVEYKIARRMKPPDLVFSLSKGVDFPFTTLGGQTRRLSELKGKVVFVNFWGTWCLPCVVEMPTIQKLYDHFTNDQSVAFVVASRLDSAERVKSWGERHDFDLPFYTIQDADIPVSLRFNQYPATFIYAKDGSLAAKHIGPANWGDNSVFTFIKKLERTNAPNPTP